MINIVRLQEKIADNYELIEKILLHIGFKKEKIKYDERKHLISSPRPEEGADNPNGCLIYTDTLYVMMTTRSFKGSLFYLVMRQKNCNFPKALESIAKWIGAKDLDEEIKYPFGGFYRKIMSPKNGTYTSLEEYSEGQLPDSNNYSYKFFRDGIDFSVQNKWGIRYCHESNEILIPIYDEFGRLVGCKSRSNDSNVDFNKRWRAFLPYQKTKVVYGMFQNYESILKRQTVVVFEAEKSVLQCSSFGFNLGVAIAGHSISEYQAKLIKSLMVNNIIVAFDQDVCREEAEFEARKLKLNIHGIRNKVRVICDEEKRFLGKKESPSDNGKRIFSQLLKECCYEI